MGKRSIDSQRILSLLKTQCRPILEISKSKNEFVDTSGGPSTLKEHVKIGIFRNFHQPTFFGARRSPVMKLGNFWEIGKIFG